MTLADEYSKKVKIPLLFATLVRFDRGDAPGVQSRGSFWGPQVLSCDLDFSFGQSCASCTIQILSPINPDTGEYVTFRSMDAVVIKQGYNTLGSQVQTFFGFVDKVVKTNPPRIQTLHCRDILKLPINTTYVTANKRVYSSVVTSAGEGGQSVAARQAEQVISDLLCDSGIPSGLQNLAITNYTVGEDSVAEFVNESAMDVINRICDAINHTLWADPTGVVQLKHIRPYASATPRLTYGVAEYTYSGAWWDSHVDREGSFVESSAGSLINVVETSVDDEVLYNWINVYAYSGSERVDAIVYGDSNYVPDPPRYKRIEVGSYPGDISRLEAIASGIYEDLNRLQYSATVEIEGDPRSALGSTIRVIDPWTTTESGIDYFLYGYSSRQDGVSFVETLDLVGGSGEGSPPATNAAPIAMFSSDVARETVDGVDWFIISVDASGSYDPDGTLSTSSYEWTVAGFETRYGAHQSFAVNRSEYGDYVFIRLTITDSGSATDSVTYIIDLTRDDIRVRSLYVSASNIVKGSTDGGKTWKSATLY